MPFDKYAKLFIGYYYKINNIEVHLSLHEVVINTDIITVKNKLQLEKDIKVIANNNFKGTILPDSLELKQYGKKQAIEYSIPTLTPFRMDIYGYILSKQFDINNTICRDCLHGGINYIIYYDKTTNKALYAINNHYFSANYKPHVAIPSNLQHFFDGNDDDTLKQELAINFNKTGDFKIIINYPK